jgi:lactoylglutathione lyase
LLLISFSINGLLHAQESSNSTFSFNHLALSVKDINRSVDFYTKVFQLKEITNRSAMDGIRWISLNEGKELILIAVLKEPVVINKAVSLALATKNIDVFVRH